MKANRKRAKVEGCGKKRNKIYDLSIEILHKINEYLSMQDRYQLALLDHHFYKIFIPLVYERIEWHNNYGMEKLQFEKFGKYIKSLDFSYVYSMSDKLKILHCLYKLFPQKVYLLTNTPFIEKDFATFTTTKRFHCNYFIEHLKIYDWYNTNISQCFFSVYNSAWEKQNCYLIKRLDLDFSDMVQITDAKFFKDFQKLYGLESINITYTYSDIQYNLEAKLSSLTNLSNLHIIYKDGDYDVSTILNGVYHKLTHLTLKVKKYYKPDEDNIQPLYFNSSHFPKLKYVDIDLPLTSLIFKGQFENMQQFFYSIDSLTTCYNFDPTCFPKLKLLRLSGSKSLMSYNVSPTINVIKGNASTTLDINTEKGIECITLDYLNTIQLGKVELNLNFINFLSKRCPNFKRLYLNKYNFSFNIEHTCIQSFSSTFSIETLIIQGDEDDVFYKLFIENSPSLKYIFAENVEYAHKLINNTNILVFPIDKSCAHLSAFKFFE